MKQPPPACVIIVSCQKMQQLCCWMYVALTFGDINDIDLDGNVRQETVRIAAAFYNPNRMTSSSSPPVFRDPDLDAPASPYFAMSSARLLFASSLISFGFVSSMTGKAGAAVEDGLVGLMGDRDLLRVVPDNGARHIAFL